MKRLFAFLCLLLFAVSCWANGAYVNTTLNSANSNITSWTPTAGNFGLAVISTSAGGGSPTVTNVQDSSTATWTQALATTYDATKNAYFSIFYKSNLASGITSLTVTINGGTPGTCQIAIVQYSGIATTSPFIVEAHQGQSAPGTGANAISSGAATVSSQPAIVIGITQNDGNSDTAAGTGYTGRFTGNNDWFVQDKRVTSTGSNTATATAATHGGTDVYWTTIIAIKEPATATLDGSMFLIF